MAVKVPFLDLRLDDPVERTSLLAAMTKVMDHGRLVMGPEIEEFETHVATYCGRRHGLAVGSGTDALYLALRALDLGPGDEVITTSLSWIATANAIALTGATPVFADIGDDLNICPASVRRLLSERTKAILAVDYSGRICAMEALEALCAENHIALIEDGSQAFGATRLGRRCGNFGRLAAISHNPMKVFAALGEAGSVVCDDDALQERLMRLRYNGTVNREVCVEPSLNGRMDTLQAAVLLARLQTLGTLIARRRDNAAYYMERFAGRLGLPLEGADERQVFYTFHVRHPQRDALERHLNADGIETKVQHRLIMPDHPAYRERARGEFTHARAMSAQILCLPIHEKLTPAQRRHVADSVLAFLDQQPTSQA